MSMSVACALRLSLRTFKHEIPQQSAISLAQCSLRSRNGAIFDRYNTIRIFFTRQCTTVCPTAPLAPPRREILTPPRPIFFQKRTVQLGVLSLRRLYSERRTMTEAGEEENRDSTPPVPDEPPPQSDLQSALNHAPGNLEHYPRFLRRLAASQPHLHRPTRDDFLKVASGFWQRTLIRFRWLSIRSFRKFNADDISAFVTWFLMSQTLWILIWT
jgi:mitochondrial distribution and morphology protein 31